MSKREGAELPVNAYRRGTITRGTSPSDDPHYRHRPLIVGGFAFGDTFEVEPFGVGSVVDVETDGDGKPFAIVLAFSPDRRVRFGLLQGDADPIPNSARAELVW